MYAYCMLSAADVDEKVLEGFHLILEYSKKEAMLCTPMLH